jgi:hypothetical protein
MAGGKIHSPKAKVLAHGEVEKLVAMHAVRSDRHTKRCSASFVAARAPTISHRKWRTCRREQIALCTV